MEKDNHNVAPHSKEFTTGSTPYSLDSNDAELAAGMTSYEKVGFWTRMGCTPESFKRRTLADKHNQLNQTLKPRHLHMIAIGGSIGAGLFVGSGGALQRGVSFTQERSYRRAYG